MRPLAITPTLAAPLAITPPHPCGPASYHPHPCPLWSAIHHPHPCPQWQEREAMRMLEGSHKQLAARLRAPGTTPLATTPTAMPPPMPTPTPTPSRMPALTPTHTLWFDAAAYHRSEAPPAAHEPNPAGYIPSTGGGRARAVLAAGRASPVEGALSMGAAGYHPCMGAAGYHPCMGAAGAVGAVGAGG